jgi:zinc transport system substrate-binding protein
MRRTALILLLAMGGALLASAAAGQTSGTPLQAFVSVPPQGGLLERIGGERVLVDVLVKPGQDPHTFEATPREIMALGQARIYFRIGLPFEETLLPKVQSNRQLAVVACDQGIAKRSLERGEDTADAGPAGEPDPHVWLSPPLLVVMAKNMAGGLSGIDPEHAAEYSAHLQVLTDEINAIHDENKRILDPYRGRSIFVYHPAFGYFAEAYGLRQVAVEAEGKSPTPRQLQHLIDQAKAEHVRVIFVQPQFDDRSAKLLAEALGGGVVPLDDLAWDILGSLRQMGQQVADALAPGGGGQ